MDMTLDKANALVSAAIGAVNRGGLPPVSVWVVDAWAHPVAFARMDGTFLGANDVAQRKARTAALFHVNSAVRGEHLRPDAAAYSLENSNGRLIGFGGGVVVRNRDGIVIGAVGISGASVDEDEAIAQAAVAALGR